MICAIHFAFACTERTTCNAHSPLSHAVAGRWPPRSGSICTSPKHAPMASESPAPLPCLDDYEVLSLLGRGSFGTVSRVRRRADGRAFVWKELHYGLMRDKEKELVVSEVRRRRRRARGVALLVQNPGVHSEHPTLKPRSTSFGSCGTPTSSGTTTASLTRRRQRCGGGGGGSFSPAPGHSGGLTIRPCAKRRRSTSSWSCARAATWRA
jgi:hypothetical protein